jgi:hypothetical protein
MKIIIFLTLVVISSCTQKYADFDLINKRTFKADQYERPMSVKPMLQGVSDDVKRCFNQWLFFSNAEKQKIEEIPYLIKITCPKDDYLINTKITETWWTTIIFSRACVEIEAHCPKSN